jgi:hypothetical protein
VSSFLEKHELAEPHRRPQLRLRERREGESGRAELEQLVAGAFERSHGATIRSFMPTLVGLEDRGGALRGAALGYRGAGSGPLFLEQYLDQPIERAIAARLPDARAVDRASVVEVGNLAGRGCRSAMYLVAQLPRFLVGKGYRWLTFTGTSRVRELLEGFGAPLLDLGSADPARLAGGADEWGRYYDTAPRVMAGWLPDGLKFSR